MTDKETFHCQEDLTLFKKMNGRFKINLKLWNENPHMEALWVVRIADTELN
jgi:hypothetical protein